MLDPGSPGQVHGQLGREGLEAVKELTRTGTGA